MTKEEQLKIYSAYLPYGLKFISNKDNQQYLLTGIDNIIKWPLWASTEWNDKSHKYEPEINLKPGGTIGNGFKLKEVKPVLYPLEYLTKEIDHEGESFIPIVELLKIKFPNQQGRYATTEYSTYGHPFACFRVDAGKQIRINTSDLENQPYWIIQKLTEWKLNVFGLEESEYINKATLTQKQ